MFTIDYLHIAYKEKDMSFHTQIYIIVVLIHAEILVVSSDQVLHIFPLWSMQKGGWRPSKKNTSIIQHKCARNIKSVINNANNILKTKLNVLHKNYTNSNHSSNICRDNCYTITEPRLVTSTSALTLVAGKEGCTFVQ